ncbi:unnamed protein product [Ostreobium quekettii]|uniref:Uncharacterized protein n=1 Tax=Ostreobium quekettii TaxID=121088 RepID=A0A8S1JFE5_9CHLO|nr:unnamed protein product [Ostreobium quekettii]|eukprot:evm.model.scf_137.6 EVM.evm.TU.scf_137.6   scf_137:60020-61819(+)
MKPSIVIAKQRRLSKDTPWPRKLHTLQSPPPEFANCHRHDSEPSSAPHCRGPSSRPTDSPAAALGPAMTFLDGHWSPSSLSDADSTVAGSDPDLQTEGCAPAADRDHRRMGSRGATPVKSMEVRLKKIRAPGGVGGASGRDGSSGRPDSFMLEGAQMGAGAMSHLTVRTGVDGEQWKVQQPLALSGEAYHALMDTCETLSPVPSDLYLTREGSQEEDGLTLFVNPMAFCDTAESGDLNAAVDAQENVEAFPLGKDRAMGMVMEPGSTMSGSKEELRKVEEKMGKQVFPSNGRRWHQEKLPTVGMEHQQGMGADSEEESGVALGLVGVGSSSSEEWRAHSITIEESIEALKSGAPVKRISVTSGMPPMECAADVAGRKKGLSGELQVPSWADSGIGHFREDSRWEDRTEWACEPPMKPDVQPDAVPPHCHSGKRFLFCSQDVRSPTALAARRRAFLKSRSRKAARRKDSSDGSPTWAGPQGLNAVVDRACRDVKPHLLVRKGRSLSESLQSFQGRSDGVLPRYCMGPPPWDGYWRSETWWSDEALTVSSQSSSQQSDGVSLGSDKKTRSLTKIEEDMEMSRDRHWGGLSIGVLSLLLLLL